MITKARKSFFAHFSRTVDIDINVESSTKQPGKLEPKIP